MPKPGDVYLTLLPDLSTQEAVLVSVLSDGGWLVQVGSRQIEVDRRQLRKKVGTAKVPRAAAKRHATAPKPKKAKAKKKVAKKKAAKKKAAKKAAKKVVKKKVAKKVPRKKAASKRRGLLGCGEAKKTYYVPEEWLGFNGRTMRSYMASDFSSLKPGKVLSVRPFEHDGELWVSTSGFWGGSKQPFFVAMCQSLTPKSRFKGKSFKTYGDWRKSKGQRYRGLVVKFKGKDYVIDSLACFVPQEHVSP